MTHLLVATKQLLETLTQWSRGEANESEVSDVYVRLGYEFNIACRAFNSIGVDTQDLGPVPDLLRSILEETLSQEASQASLDRFLPRIRDIIINLLYGLKKKQQRLRQRTASGSGSAPGSGTGSGQNSRQASTTSSASFDPASALSTDDPLWRQSGSRSHAAPPRAASGDFNGSDLPPRSTSVQGGRSSPRKDGFSPNNSISGARDPSRDTLSSDSSSLSSNAMQNMPVIAPYPDQDNMPVQPQPPPHQPSQASDAPRTYYSEDALPPPPPPPKQQDALAALQRGGDLERRASRRFSAYQIQKHLGSANGIPMIPPAQNSPVPNRGKDTRESMNAVRTRSSYLHNRQKSGARALTDLPRRDRPNDRRISEEPNDSGPPAQSEDSLDSPHVETPEDKHTTYPFPVTSPNGLVATVNGPISEPVLPKTPEAAQRNGTLLDTSDEPQTSSKQAPIQQSSSQPNFVPESSPQPGKELTLFLQYKTKIKKFVLPDGGDLSIPRLQLAFIEKFAWNTHNNGNDLPEIYVQDPVSGVRHELEDLSDVKDRSVLVLNVEALDEVKRHFDDGLGGIKSVIEGLRTAVDNQQSAIQRVSEKQQETAKEIASLAAAPRPSNLPPSRALTNVKDASGQLDEVQSLRRDLAVVRQTYSSFVEDINASMSAIKSKAASVKSVAEKARIPSLSANTGRSYVNTGKQSLSDDSEKLVTRVDDLQDTVEDLRKDVVTRGVRPLPRQLDTVSKDISAATAALKKLQEFLKKEKPVWTKIWEKELQVVCDDRDLLTMQEELCVDLEDDLEKAAATFALVEQATRQQHLQNTSTNTRSASRTLIPVALDQGADPHKAKDGVLGEVRALQPNHESRLEAIERAERARKKELEDRRGGEFQKELGNFVEEGKLKKTGGAEEVERLRKIKDERNRKEVWEIQQARAAKIAAAEAREAAEKAKQAASAETQADVEGSEEPAAAEASSLSEQDTEKQEEGAAEEVEEQVAEAEAADTPGELGTSAGEQTEDSVPEEASNGVESATVEEGGDVEAPTPEAEYVEAKEHPTTPSAE